MPTIEAQLTLLDNYNTDVRSPEDHTSSEQAEENEFLSKVMETRVMKKAYEFCSDKGTYLRVFFRLLINTYDSVKNNEIKYLSLLCRDIFWKFR